MLNRIRVLVDIEFQFHKGTIRTSGGAGVETPLDYFNSIKVRLERTK